MSLIKFMIETAMTYSDVQIGEFELAWLLSPIFLRVGVKALLPG
jgi:hypothetical protein